MALTKEQKEKAIMALVSWLQVDSQNYSKLVDVLDDNFTSQKLLGFYNTMQTDVANHIASKKTALDDEVAAKKALLDNIAIPSL